MHEYKIILPTNTDRIMDLIGTAVNTFGNEAVRIGNDHSLIIRTAMNLADFWTFLVESGSGVGSDEFQEMTANEVVETPSLPAFGVLQILKAIEVKEG